MKKKWANPLKRPFKRLPSGKQTLAEVTSCCLATTDFAGSCLFTICRSVYVRARVTQFMCSQHLCTGTKL